MTSKSEDSEGREVQVRESSDCGAGRCVCAGLFHGVGLQRAGRLSARPASPGLLGAMFQMHLRLYSRNFRPHGAACARRASVTSGLKTEAWK